MREGPLVPATIAARLLRLDARTVRGWIRRGELAGTQRCGRYYVHRSALRALLGGKNGIQDTIKVEAG